MMTMLTMFVSTFNDNSNDGDVDDVIKNYDDND